MEELVSTGENAKRAAILTLSFFKFYFIVVGHLTQELSLELLGVQYITVDCLNYYLSPFAKNPVGRVFLTPFFSLGTL